MKSRALWSGDGATTHGPPRSRFPVERFRSDDASWLFVTSISRPPNDGVRRSPPPTLCRGVDESRLNRAWNGPANGSRHPADRICSACRVRHRHNTREICLRELTWARGPPRVSCIRNKAAFSFACMPIMVRRMSQKDRISFRPRATRRLICVLYSIFYRRSSFPTLLLCQFQPLKIYEREFPAIIIISAVYLIFNICAY